MKNLAMFALLWIFVSSPVVFAQNITDKRCHDLLVVMQHKTLEIKLRLKIAPNLIDAGGEKRCPRKDEMVAALEEKFSEYTVEDYKELFEQRK